MQRFTFSLISNMHSNYPEIKIFHFLPIKSKEISQKHRPKMSPLCILKLLSEAGFSPGPRLQCGRQPHRPPSACMGGCEVGTPFRACAPIPRRVTCSHTGQSQCAAVANPTNCFTWDTIPPSVAHSL